MTDFGSNLDKFTLHLHDFIIKACRFVKVRLDYKITLTNVIGMQYNKNVDN